MSPRRKNRGAPPGLAEDADQLAAEASAQNLGIGPQEAAPPGRKSGRPPKRSKLDAPGAVAPPPIGGEVTFPVEALAVLHLEVWNILAVRLRSRWALSPEGAAEMARYGEIVMRQYLGPYLAEHAALAGYAMTQATALVALIALRETPQVPPAKVPDGDNVQSTGARSGIVIAAGAPA